MVKRYVGSAIALLLLNGCYCENYYNQNSSVRYLRGNHSFTICHEPQGLKDGKKVLATVYTADPFLQRLDFKKAEEKNILSEIKFSGEWHAGLRMQQYFIPGKFPGPLYGFGLDYSRSQFTASYTTVKNGFKEQQVQTMNHQRAHLNLSYVTWIRSRMMGYAFLEPGFVWSKRNTVSDNANYSTFDKNWINYFNYRFGYGFQFYIRPLINVNLEFGYGSGAFVRGGVGVWVF